jgi:hypothetical protein
MARAGSGDEECWSSLEGRGGWLGRPWPRVMGEAGGSVVDGRGAVGWGGNGAVKLGAGGMVS